MPDSALGDIEKKLYGREKPPEPPPPSPRPPAPPPPPPPEKKWRFRFTPQIRKWLTWALVGIVAIGVLFAIYIFWQGFFGFNAGKVSLSIQGPDSIIVGEEMTWRVEIQNNNRSALRNGTLLIQLPTGFYDPETEVPLTTIEERVDQLAPGAQFEELFSAVVIGGDNFRKTVQVVFQFQPEEGTLTFQKEISHTGQIKEFPVSVDIDGAQETLSGETIPIRFTIFNELGRTFDNLRARIEYPSGFDLLNSQHPLSEDGRIWSFGVLEPSEEVSQEIFGMITGSEGEGKVFRVFLEYQEGQDWRAYKEAAFLVRIAETPLDLDIQIRNKEAAVELDEPLQYEIRWRNNFDVPLSDLTLIAKLEGIFDLTTLKTEGDILGAQSEIRWTGKHSPALRSIRPNGEGMVSFRIHTPEEFPRTAVNPVLKVRATLDSQSRPQGLTASQIRAIRIHETKINGRIDLESFAYYNDPNPNPSFRNSGPYPLEVGKATTFTVHWKLTSFANAFENVNLRAILPSGVDWVGEISVPRSFGNLEFDSSLREVRWRINLLPAGSGLFGSAPEAVFKISVRPAPANAGRVMSLLSETQLIARDAFTGNRFETVASEIDSSLPRDTSVSGKSQRVKELE